MRTPQQALAAIRAKARAHTFIGVGDCQLNAHNIYLIGGGAPTAAAAFESARYKHGPEEKPTPGAFVFWSGGQTISHITGKPAGHVGVYSPSGWPFSRASFWSPGAPGTQADAGVWKRMKMADLAKGWPGHTYEGWTEDINGVRVPGLETKMKKSKPAKNSIRTVFWNAFVGNSGTNLAVALDAFKVRGAEVIVLQEVYNKHVPLKQWAVNNGFELVHDLPGKPSKPGNYVESGEGAILVRRNSAAKIKRRKSFKAGPTWVGPNGEVHDPREVANVLVTFSGKRGTGKFASIHAPIGGPKASRPRNAAAWKSYTRRVVKWINATLPGRFAVAAGDWNTSLENLQTHGITANGFESGWLDHIAVKGAKVTNISEQGKFGSDHSAIMADVTPN